MNKLLRFFCAALLCHASNTYAQISTMALPGGGGSSTVDIRTDLISSSPEAASFAKYGIIPVSLYTGVPDVSIPLGEAAGREISLPISLSYHYTGMQPSETASRVGLGWTLNAGGAITRAMRDKADGTRPAGHNYDDVAYNVPSLSQDFLYHAGLGEYDTEPDLYSFNFGSYSGQFTIIHNQVQMLPFSKVKITKTGETFKITADDGTVYYFEQKEYTYPRGSVPNTHITTEYISAWYLSKVVSASGKDTITLSYSSPVDINYNGVLSQTYKKAADNPSNESVLSDKQTSYPTRVASVTLSSIQTSKMYVSFVNGFLRTDLNATQSYTLGDILITDNGGTTKSFHLNQEYFGGGGLFMRKLKLKSVEERSSATGANGSKMHKFSYLNEFDPWSFSDQSIDHWGFLNGTTDPERLIPNTIIENGANREPQIQYAQYGALRKIIYPTGGSTVFDFELNHYFNGKNKEYRVARVQTSASRSVASSPVSYSPTGNFHIGEPQYVKVFYKRQTEINNNPFPTGAASQSSSQPVPNTTPGGGPTVNTDPEVVIRKGDVDGPSVFEGKILLEAENIGKTDSVLLDTGRYYVTVECDKSEIYAETIVSGKDPTGRYLDGPSGPGLRIKTITSYKDSLATQLALKKEYAYNDSSGISTGHLAASVAYSQNLLRYEAYDDQNNLVKAINFTVYASANNASMGSLIQQAIYYSKVYEKETNANDPLDFHLSMSEFGTFAPAYTVITNLPVFLKSKTDFIRDGTTYRPLTKSRYFYKTVLDDSFNSIRPYMSIERTAGARNSEYNYNSILIRPTWQYLNSESQTTYISPTDSVTTNTYYGYDLPAVRNQIYTRKTGTNGKEYITKTKYPENYTGLLSTLVSKNVIVPIEQQTWLKKSATDSVLLTGSITQYDEALIKPVKQYVLKIPAPVTSLNQETKSGNLYTSLLSDNRYELRITNTYDNSTANLTSQDLLSSAGKKQVSYLWGYSNNYPIAKIKNAALGASAFTSFESDDSSWVYTGTTNLTAHGGMKGFSGTMQKSGLPAGNYLVRFWAKGSGNITVGTTSVTLTTTWQYYQLQLNGVSSVSINTNGSVVDDVSLYPEGAQMETYTYLPGTGLSSSADSKGLTTNFEYDDFQRLANIRDEDKNILKNFKYNYIGNPIVMIPNQAQFRDFVKQCDAGITGSTVRYTVPAGRYSAISQAGADELALADINSNGQAYANANGTCTVTPTIKMVRTSTYVSGDGHTNGIYTFYAYADQNATIPFTATAPISIKYRLTSTTTVNGTNPTITNTAGTITMAIGESSKQVWVDEASCPVNAEKNAANGGATTNDVPGGGTTCVTTVITFLSGTGYNVYNTQ